MDKAAFPALALLILAACGNNATPGNQGGSQEQAASSDDAEAGTGDIGNTRHLTGAQKAKYDVGDARLGDNYASVKRAWLKAHPNFRADTKTGWAAGVGSFVTDLRFSSASGDDAFEARFTSPASGNRAFFLSHTLQDMGVGHPVDRKAAEALIADKFGDTALKDGPNIYGGEIVGRDGQLVDGCANFKFPDSVNSEGPTDLTQCGLTALATIDADNDSTANAVTLQLTDFALLARLADDETAGEQREREEAGRAALKGAVKPTAL